MNRTSPVCAAAVVIVASVPLFTSWIPLSLNSPPPTYLYPGQQAFFHETGHRHPQGWEAYYREHRPGYLLGGLKSGGERLAEGTYRYDFRFALRPGTLSSLLSKANDVVRLEAADVTTHEILTERTFQVSDFIAPKKGIVVKSLTFSTQDRKNHLFEPRVYWPGLSGIFLQRVELTALGVSSADNLRQKAEQFERSMPQEFLERGYVVVRDEQGKPSDLGDAAIWTGIYAAAEALRYKTTQDPAAQRQMEKSLWALHALVHASPLSGTMVRFVDAAGHVLEEPASKDTYTGFFYGAARSLPYIRHAALRQALLADVDSLAGHFLDQDLTFKSPYGQDLDLNPYLSRGFVFEALRDLHRNAALRRDLIRTFRLARWYFWIHGQRPPPSFTRLIVALKHPDTAHFESEFLPLVNDLHRALKTIQKNVHRSALRGPREGLNDTPYIKLDLLLLRALRNFQMDTGGKEFTSLEDLKVLPSQSLHALHFIKVAAEMLPKPNRYERFYAANLYEGKALLRTAVQWHQIDEEALAAVLGETEVDTRRTASSHLSYLALHDLILLEKDPQVRFIYQRLFEDQYQPMRGDGNAMIDAMHAAVGLSTKQLGLALWSLDRYPVDRRGKGDAYWIENREALLAAYGGWVNGQARDPLPPDVRPRDAFLWQRSAHSIRGDHEGWLYPPLDYLFAYWLARTTLTPENSPR